MKDPVGIAVPSESQQKPVGGAVRMTENISVSAKEIKQQLFARFREYFPIPAVALPIFGFTEKEIAFYDEFRSKLSRAEQEEAFRSRKKSIVSHGYFGCARYRSQTQAKVQGERLNQRLCDNQYCSICGPIKMIDYHARLVSIIKHWYDEHEDVLAVNYDSNDEVLDRIVRRTLIPKSDVLVPEIVASCISRGIEPVLGTPLLVTFSLSKKAPDRILKLHKAMEKLKHNFLTSKRSKAYTDLGVVAIVDVAENTFGHAETKGVHHHSHCLFFTNQLHDPRASDELVLATKFYGLFREVAKKVYGKAWKDSYLKAPFLSKRSVKNWTQHEQSGNWESASELRLVELDYVYSINPPDEQGKFLKQARSPVKGGISASVACRVEDYLTVDEWDISKEMAGGAFKSSTDSITTQQVLNVIVKAGELKMLHWEGTASPGLGGFDREDEEPLKVYSYDRYSWYPYDKESRGRGEWFSYKDLVPYSIDKFVVKGNDQQLIEYVTAFEDLKKDTHYKRAMKFSKVGKPAKHFDHPDFYPRILPPEPELPEGVVEELSPFDAAVFYLSDNHDDARNQMIALAVKELKLKPVIDEDLATFLELYEKDWKRFLGQVDGLPAKAKKTKKLIRLKADIELINEAQDAEHDARLKIKFYQKELAIILRRLCHYAPSMFNSKEQTFYGKHFPSKESVVIAVLALNESLPPEVLGTLSRFCNLLEKFEGLEQGWYLQASTMSREVLSDLFKPDASTVASLSALTARMHAMYSASDSTIEIVQPDSFDLSELKERPPVSFVPPEIKLIDLKSWVQSKIALKNAK